nr:hypothetical protein [Tanacetum cinerariifolium]
WNPDGGRDEDTYVKKGQMEREMYEDRTFDKLNYLELPIPATLVSAVAGQQVPPGTLAAPAAWVKRQKIVVLMLMTMKPDLQRNLETLGAYDMLKELKTVSLTF